MKRREFMQRAGMWAAAPAFVGCLSSVDHAVAADPSARVPTAGPLRVHPKNPRYFADASGRVVYLTGSHTWNNLTDIGAGNPPPAFDFTEYLDFLERFHHNFIRLWRYEVTRWDAKATPQWTNHKDVYSAAPHPWKRTGPGEALDGQPKFDLTQFDPQYFDRLRKRVQAARERGIYVSVMLFEGWGLQHLLNGFNWHPFNAANNVNGIHADIDGDGRGIEAHTLQVPAVQQISERYVRKVIDTVNDLDNVLYEITNETGTYSLDWQYHLIRFIKDCERDKPQQHPVGITYLHSQNKEWRGTNAVLFESPADWISPCRPAADGYDYRTNPPSADGRKVILSDTDHIFAIGGDVDWVWKTFLRGHNPLFMDPYDNSVLGKTPPQSWDALRQSLGQTRRVASRVDLATMVPHGELASTEYCLADPGREYLVYLPEGGAVEVDLSAAREQLATEWMHPVTGATRLGDSADGGGKRTLRAPMEGAAVLLLQKAK